MKFEKQRKVLPDLDRYDEEETILAENQAGVRPVPSWILLLLIGLCLAVAFFLWSWIGKPSLWQGETGSTVIGNAKPIAAKASKQATAADIPSAVPTTDNLPALDLPIRSTVSPTVENLAQRLESLEQSVAALTVKADSIAEKMSDAEASLESHRDELATFRLELAQGNHGGTSGAGNDLAKKIQAHDDNIRSFGELLSGQHQEFTIFRSQVGKWMNTNWGKSISTAAIASERKSSKRRKRTRRHEASAQPFIASANASESAPLTSLELVSIDHWNGVPSAVIRGAAGLSTVEQGKTLSGGWTVTEIDREAGIVLVRNGQGEVRRIAQGSVQ